MGRSTSTTPREVEEPPPTPRRSLFFCCCGSAVDDLAQEVQLQVKAARAPPPLELQHGYANEENEKRGMAAPKFGTFEVTGRHSNPATRCSADDRLIDPVFAACSVRWSTRTGRARLLGQEPPNAEPCGMYRSVNSRHAGAENAAPSAGARGDQRRGTSRESA